MEVSKRGLQAAEITWRFGRVPVSDLPELSYFCSLEAALAPGSGLTRIVVLVLHRRRRAGAKLTMTDFPSGVGDGNARDQACGGNNKGRNGRHGLDTRPFPCQAQTQGSNAGGDVVKEHPPVSQFSVIL